MHGPAVTDEEGGLSADDRDGYPTTWTDGEVRAHLRGDMERLSKLQLERMQWERQVADSRSRSGRTGATGATSSHMPSKLGGGGGGGGGGGQEAISAKPGPQPQGAQVTTPDGKPATDPAPVTGIDGEPPPTKRKRVDAL
mmetsp:Transcript_18363/g.55285  ORF Transcript_18363/g.55285 Transcript_18363/m.55285 type:complete len:140 (-) Transcript_18363:2320-2739(-)